MAPALAVPHLQTYDPPRHCDLNFLETVERRGNSVAEAGAEDVSYEVTASLRSRYSEIPPGVDK